MPWISVQPTYLAKALEAVAYEGPLLNPTPLRVDRMEAWISALESGQYRQIKSILHDDTADGFCAFGVAVDLYAEQTGKIAWGRPIPAPVGKQKARPILHLKGNSSIPEGSPFSPPLEVVDWYGLLTVKEPLQKIFLMNDGDEVESKSFPEIAIYLKETYL